MDIHRWFERLDTQQSADGMNTHMFFSNKDYTHCTDTQINTKHYVHTRNAWETQVHKQKKKNLCTQIKVDISLTRFMNRSLSNT